jgi:hypothetical protein
MSRGVGLLLLLAGSVLLAEDSLGSRPQKGRGLDVLLLMVGSGLLLDSKKKEDHP